MNNTNHLTVAPAAPNSRKLIVINTKSMTTTSTALVMTTCVQQQQQQQQQQVGEPIYENLCPVTCSALPENENNLLYKYFRSSAASNDTVYENLCRGCGYGVFEARGKLCNFCQCIATGRMQHLATSTSSTHIYENICGQCCRSYDENETCACIATPPLSSPLSAAKHKLTFKLTKSKSFRKLKKPEFQTHVATATSSRSILSNFFGSLKQLNRSASGAGILQLLNTPSMSPSKKKSREIIHHVEGYENVFHTKTTFDLQRMCELKRTQKSCSDQHIYGRLKCKDEMDEETRKPLTSIHAAAATAEKPAFEMSNFVRQQSKSHDQLLESLGAVQKNIAVQQNLDDNLANGKGHHEMKANPKQTKRPRISRIRLLHYGAQQQPDSNLPSAVLATDDLHAVECSGKNVALYLNESIRQWMTSLRHETHMYNDMAAYCQQPKSVPSACNLHNYAAISNHNGNYNKEEYISEKQQNQQDLQFVTLRRCLRPNVVYSERESVDNDEERHLTPVEQMVVAFKRNLERKLYEHVVQYNDEQDAGTLKEQERVDELLVKRRCMYMKSTIKTTAAAASQTSKQEYADQKKEQNIQNKPTQMQQQKNNMKHNSQYNNNSRSYSNNNNNNNNKNSNSYTNKDANSSAVKNKIIATTTKTPSTKLAMSCRIEQDWSKFPQLYTDCLQLIQNLCLSSSLNTLIIFYDNTLRVFLKLLNDSYKERRRLQNQLILKSASEWNENYLRRKYLRLCLHFHLKQHQEQQQKQQEKQEQTDVRNPNAPHSKPTDSVAYETLLSADTKGVGCGDRSSCMIVLLKKQIECKTNDDGADKTDRVCVSTGGDEDSDSRQPNDADKFVMRVAREKRQTNVAKAVMSEEHNKNNNEHKFIKNLQQRERAKTKLMKTSPQVPQRDPKTVLTTAKQLQATGEQNMTVLNTANASHAMATTQPQRQQQAVGNNSNNNDDDDDNDDDGVDDDDDNNNNNSNTNNNNKSKNDEEDIYQPIWKFKTVGEAREYYDDIVMSNSVDDYNGDDDDDEDNDDEKGDKGKNDNDRHAEDGDDDESEEMPLNKVGNNVAVTGLVADEYETLKATAAFAAGARQRFMAAVFSGFAGDSSLLRRCRQRVAEDGTKYPILVQQQQQLTQQLEIDDHGDWETDDEFMFITQLDEQLQQQQQFIDGNIASDTLRSSKSNKSTGTTLSSGSEGSTITNCGSSTATLTSIGEEFKYSCTVNKSTITTATTALPHNQKEQRQQQQLYRNVGIFYSVNDQSVRAIVYDYDRLRAAHYFANKNTPAIKVHLSNEETNKFTSSPLRPAPPPPTLTPRIFLARRDAYDDSGVGRQTPYGVDAKHNANDDKSFGWVRNWERDCEREKEWRPPLPPPRTTSVQKQKMLTSESVVAVNRIDTAMVGGRDKCSLANSLPPCQKHHLLPDSVQAWKFMLLDVNYIEDEEDMIVSSTEVRRSQETKEDKETQKTHQLNILQRFKSASISNLVNLPSEDDKKSIGERMRFKYLRGGVFKINMRSPKSEKKSRSIFRRPDASSLYLEDGLKAKYPIFGAPLDQTELNTTTHPNVPRFVVDVVKIIEKPDFIQQDGLYRASGNKLSIDELKQKLSENYLYNPAWLQTEDIHTLTSLHKQFFRELCDPLIPEYIFEQLDINLNEDGTVEQIRRLFDEMPEPNRSTLRFLMKHLTNVAAHASHNRMPASNLAIVWGPCLLAGNLMEFNFGRMNVLAKVLVENYDRIFVPENERLVC